MATKLNEGEIKITKLPTGALHQMVEEKRYGVHTIAIQKLVDIDAAKVVVNNYPSWDRAFDAAMDKAGL